MAFVGITSHARMLLLATWDWKLEKVMLRDAQQAPQITQRVQGPHPCLPRPSFGPCLNLALLYIVPNLGRPSTSLLLKPAHSLGDDRVVEQGVPALLNFPKGEAAAELHTQVDRRQVISLQDPRLVCSSPALGRILPLEAKGPARLVWGLEMEGVGGIPSPWWYLQHSIDEEEVICRLPSAQILGHLKWLFAFLHTLGKPRGRGRAGWYGSTGSLGHLGTGQDHSKPYQKS